jgi:superfamily II DNA or RNA helicase
MIHFDYNESTRKMQVTSEDLDLFEELRTHFSVKNEGADFARRKLSKDRARFVSDRLYMIKPTGYCLAGLYDEIRQWCIQRQITGVTFSDSFQKYIDDGFQFDVYDNYDEYKLRDYQKQFLERGIATGRGVCVLGTGGGKTLICASLIDSYYQACENKKKFKCIVVVPNIGLVTQTYNDFKDYGVTFSYTRWTGKQTPDFGANVIIVNSAILLRRFKDRENKWIKEVDLVLVDEVHGLTNGNKITEAVSKIKTTHKYGFTGTLPDNKHFRWNVIGAIGPVIFEKSSGELRKEGYLTNAQVRRIEISYKTHIPVKHDNDYYNELDYIYESEYRNSVIKNICDKYDKNILILVNHIRHGEILQDVLQQLGRPTYFIQGNVEVDDRVKVIELIESTEGVICIAISKIFSTGINIKNLHMLIFGSGGKSFIRTVQSIGRGLRLHPSKTMFNIIDICDQLHYGAEHASKRMRFYDKEKIRHKTIQLEENHG